jgi:hypothetical protein
LKEQYRRIYGQDPGIPGASNAHRRLGSGPA